MPVEAEDVSYCISLARRAGDAILDVYRGEFAVHSKGDDGPVTRADRDADEIIREGLAARFPDDALLSEETPDDLDRLAHSRVWLVDPLDGTRQFVNRIDEFAVMIGLAQDGEAVFGVIHLPIESTTFVGQVGAGAYAVEGDGTQRPLDISDPIAADRKPIAVVSRSHEKSKTRRVAVATSGNELRLSGSVGRKACLVADAQADFYVTLGRRTRHWDACAADALVRAAGGEFGDVLGGRIVYNTEETTNSRGLLACRRGLTDRLVSNVRDVVDVG